MKEKGPKYGYFPKASKTHLILKKEEDLEKATQLFEGEGIKITMEGQRHIAAAIGKVSFNPTRTGGGPIRPPPKDFFFRKFLRAPKGPVFVENLQNLSGQLLKKTASQYL